MDRRADHKYIDVYKSYTDDDGYSRIMDITNSYAAAFVDEAQNYTLSIDRWNIPLTSVPIFIMNRTPGFYTCELEYGGTSSGVIPITYVPNPQPYYSQLFDYYIYSYIQFIEYINTALETAFYNLKASVSLPTNIPPMFAYNSNVFILYLVVTDAYAKTNVTPINIYFNKEMFKFINGIPIIYKTLIANDRNCWIQCAPLINNRRTITYTNNNAIPPVTYTENGLTISSEYGNETLFNWNQAKGIVVMSYNLMTTPELIPANVNSNSGNSSLNTSTQQNPYQNVLASFDFLHGETPRSLTAQYILTSPYKRLDIMSNGPLNKIHMCVKWFDSFYNLYDLYLYPGEAMTMRFVFINKRVQS